MRCFDALIQSLSNFTMEKKEKKVPVIRSEFEPKPAFPPRLVKRQSNKFLNILRNITIEPAMFLISFSTSLDDVSLQQMTIFKSCMLDVPEAGGNETICNNLETEYRDINELVQEEVRDFTN